MWANNETGVIFPIREIGEMVRDRGIVFHTDAVQAAGKIPVDVKADGVDMLSLSGHKIHAPKGVGVLYVRKGTKFSPFLIGGHQEHGRRGGTENVASIIGLGKACELAQKHFRKESVRVKQLRDKLESGLLEKDPECRCQRRSRKPAAEHHQHRLRVHRRRIDPVDAERVRHLRLFRFGLYFRFT